MPETTTRLGIGLSVREAKGMVIPFRSLVPLKAENLLTAGRCISGSFIPHAAYRVTGDCLKTGEAAGKMAVEAIRKGITVRELSNIIYKGKETL